MLGRVAQADIHGISGPGSKLGGGAMVIMLDGSIVEP